MAAGLAGLLAAPSAFGSLLTETAVLTESGGNANGGGLFQAVTSDNGTFDTFCMSIATTFYPGAQYYYEASDTIAANDVPPKPSLVALGTAYIYDQFLKGNAHYAGVGNADAVQAAIWYLQGNLNGKIDPENGADLSSLLDPIIAQVELDNSWTLSQMLTASGGQYGVKAMDLYANSDRTGVSQPQLIQVVPEPTTLLAGAMLLLPFGVSTLRIVRRNRKA